MGPIVVLLFALSLLHLCETQGTSTGTPVFVQTGKDLFLEVNKPVTPLLQVKGSDFKWTLNDKINIVKLANGNAIILNFEDRAEFYKENYTLVLKNVQKKDSGEYIAKVSGKQEHLVAEYKVTVMDPVSPVKLEVNPSSSCNLTVICSTTDSHISSTYRCVNQTCSPEGRERSEVTTYPSIEVYLQQGLIICNHSNQVSWEQDTLEIKPLCEKQTALNAAITISIATGLATVLALVCLGLFLIYKKKRNGNKEFEEPNNGNTVYEVPQDINPAQLLNQNPTPDASSLSPTSTYCLVQFHTGPGPRESTTRDTSLPETVYAQVDRSAKTKYKSPNNQHKS
ncbi:uncharacterized protein LOC127363798 [Dicentrarchus labrax]|uniref:uncharacterized protein LOC127363798 n=1 Tax=Dicentrarchus labrax TaxID=13489 RepID=UPI0021F64829|nr:uncharacterized protein LOC127363798 [Dicentrarchus labrax]